MKIWTFEPNPYQIWTNLSKKSRSAPKSGNPDQVEAVQLYKGRNLQKRARLSSKCQNFVYFQQIIVNN